MPPPPSSTILDEPANVRGHDWYLVAVLFLVNVFNLMDRQIMSILLEPIKRELGASDTVMGLLTGFTFVVFYTLASVPIARVADRRSRRNIIAAALAFWSVMTAASGLVSSAVQLGLARLGVGLGEAATTPAGQAMIADRFPPERRASALAVLAVGVPVGVMAAFLAGGALNAAVGWRQTFFWVGVPGFLLALLVRLSVREPQRGGADRGAADLAHYGARQALRHLWSLASLRYLTAAAAFSVFTAWALLVWSPSFLIRVHGMSTLEAGTVLGLAAGVAGGAGTLLCGIASERFASRDPRWLLGVPACTTLIAVPCLVAFLLSPSRAVALPMLFVTMFFGAGMIGPVTAAVQGLAPVRTRAFAAALVTLTFNLFGVGLGPLTTGALSDRLAPVFGSASIRYALLAAAVSGLVSALFFWIAARRLPADLAAAGASPPTHPRGVYA